MTMDPVWMTAHELGAAYRNGDLSPVDAVDAILARLEQMDPELNVFVTVTADRARAEAAAAAERFAAGEDLPPLFGIPITVKDLIDTQGVRTTYGSLAYESNVPTHDDLSWGRLAESGAILIGKTTTPEFGLLGTTESHLSGVTHNPWDFDRTSGGSSGGAAAATAVGIAPIALGSDGGGSIRVPSALCGVVGFKPSTGRIPHWDNADASTTDGPIARRVIDIALMLDVLVGHDDRDRFSLPSTGENYTAAALNPRALDGVKIAASLDLGEDVVEPGVEEQFRMAIDRLLDAGAIVEEIDIALPDPAEYFVSYWGAEYTMLADALSAEGEEIWPFIEDIANRARELSPLDVSMAMRQVRTQIYNGYLKALTPHEFLLTPTTPRVAPTHAAIADTVGADGPAAHLHRLTESPSHAGLPAITVPTGVTAEGLPVGIQLIGRPHADADLISLAAAFEETTGAAFLRPPGS
jgi:Asp-tRNA(Asn)/Glu-tRNA(Gln) amidotransferase A subunit family amidase